MSRYIDPTTDFGFKKLFGTEANKEIIMSFIQDILELEQPLSDITFLDKEQLPDTEEERVGVYDIFCKTKDGTHFIVEMQKGKIDFMRDRMIYYSTFPIVAQAKKGLFEIEVDGEMKTVGWNYELSPIHCISILAYSFGDSNRCVNRNNIRNIKPPHNIFSDKLNFITVELPLFDETKPEYRLDKHLNKWLYFLQNLPGFDKIPEIFKAEIVFEKAFEIAEIARFNPQEKRFYELSLKRSRDSFAVVEYAKKEARLSGLEEGKSEGRKEGISEGKKNAKITIARTMLSKNMDTSMISEVTGLSEAEILALKKSK